MTRCAPLLASRPIRLAAVAAVAALLVAGQLASRARADGDPASDVLYGQRAFLPYDVSFPPALQTQLRGLLAEGARGGYPIRVAVVASAYDLGSVSELWREPRTYARFLGIELSLSYHGVLLVVMPNGFGLYHGGKPVAAEQKAVAGIDVHPGGRGLIQAAVTAVQRLALAAGHPLAPPRARPVPTAAAAGHSSHGHALRDALVVAAGLLLVAVAWGASLRLAPLRSRREREQGPSGAPPAGDEARRRRPRLGRLRRADPLWTAAGFAGFVALGALVAAVVLITRSTGVAPSAAAGPAQAEAIWPSGSRPSPPFRLTDSEGKPSDLAAHPGKTTIVTFIDPICRDYCPLEARVLNRAIDALPAAERPRILAVSVDPPADTEKNVRLDHVKWHLVPEWHWAFGTRAQLARVWSAYKVGVQVIPQTTAGITIRKVVHTEAAYLVDADGYQRALFLWPFTTKAVGEAIRQVTQAS